MLARSIVRIYRKSDAFFQSDCETGERSLPSVRPLDDRTELEAVRTKLRKTKLHDRSRRAGRTNRAFPPQLDRTEQGWRKLFLGIEGLLIRPSIISGHFMDKASRREKKITSNFRG